MFQRQDEPEGSLTVEAALTVPICFFAVYSFLQLFLFLWVQCEVQRKMTDLAVDLSSYGNLIASCQALMTSEGEEELLAESGFDMLLGSITEQAYLAYRMKKAVEEEPWISMIAERSYGMDVSGSSLYERDGEIRLIVAYRFQVPCAFFAFSFPVIQQVRAYGFYGRGWETMDEETDEEEVYIAETSEVYHRYSTCTYLKISVRQIPYSNLSGERNQSGGLYYPCSTCRHLLPTDTVYIASYGDRYHAALTCTSIKRNIQSISLEEAKERGLRGCSKCSKEKEEEP